MNLSNFLQSLYSGYHNKTRNNFLCSNSKYNSKIEEVTDGIKVIKNALKRKATAKGQLPSTFIKMQPVFPNKMLLSSNKGQSLSNQFPVLLHIPVARNASDRYRNPENIFHFKYFSPKH